MNFEKEEYLEIYKNYTQYEHLTPLLLDIQIWPDINEPSYLKITWIENVTENVYVCEDGWYANDFTTNQKFPTFESLAMRRSDAFNCKWGETLFAKLQELDDNAEI